MPNLRASQKSEADEARITVRFTAGIETCPRYSKESVCILHSVILLRPVHLMALVRRQRPEQQVAWGASGSLTMVTDGIGFSSFLSAHEKSTPPVERLSSNNTNREEYVAVCFPWELLPTPKMLLEIGFQPQPICLPQCRRGEERPPGLHHGDLGKHCLSAAPPAGSRNTGLTV